MKSTATAITMRIARRPSAIIAGKSANDASSRTMSAASFVAGELSGMAMPTSASLMAGRSLMPSPIITTISLLPSPLMISRLSTGVHRACTCSEGSSGTPSCERVRRTGGSASPERITRFIPMSANIDSVSEASCRMRSDSATMNNGRTSEPIGRSESLEATTTRRRLSRPAATMDS